MEAVIEQNGTNSWASMSDRFSKIGKVLLRIFGCWHVNMSLPFSRGKDTYRTCVACGARRRFDLERWEMVGSFYYPEPQFAASAIAR
jgi:hypothetical protein